MARGNQRDQARERRQKEDAKKKKPTTLSAGGLQAKKEHDAEKMREKQRLAAERQAAGAPTKK
ncbi:hypothetical protein BO70DRAFT_361119 [Aspergillus heteromorphus CBS 117.55]|uniref:Small EDRK-rich factor-like N-terminal domain-containing protein n=1 Tax=Aspergillus heteromorphus CBS 117.55 TaxID=1448321 RepID=A0A317WMM6_9EURO|nr:uncharacterized protein BO70DRAFT_361119 [Aspergillus heteromorphus CBS 117.55]PWY86288.1 hypothetical protein BO70DRAFT_361119 [Aspergillus heteromorphus CBS 117.55]